MEKIEKIIRNFENTEYYGYMFFITYDGSRFESFDENPEKRSVKAEFRNLMKENGISIFKGIQQGGRTDRGVSAEENILYINSKDFIDFSEIKYRRTDGLEIVVMKRTIPFLEFPEMVKKRHYSYKYPKKLIKNREEEIIKKCAEVSGKKDFKEFTSKKGKKLKNHVRTVFVEYREGKLYFTGDGFLPQQVRIMSNFILNGKKSPLTGEYLVLNRVELSDEINVLIFQEDILKEECQRTESILKKISNEGNYSEILKDIIKIEKNEHFKVFYVKYGKKSKIIGKKGKNIRDLKRLLGNIVVKEVKVQKKK